jgi:hypothetical protein
MQVGRLAAQEWAEAERLESWEFEHLLDPRPTPWRGLGIWRSSCGGIRRRIGREAFALADYNAGRANVLRWIDGAASTNAALFLEGMDFGGTRAYVEAVLERWGHYRGSNRVSTGAEP